jgi:hypothetical protein
MAVVLFYSKRAENVVTEDIFQGLFLQYSDYRGPSVCTLRQQTSVILYVLVSVCLYHIFDFSQRLTHLISVLFVSNGYDQKPVGNSVRAKRV